MRTHLLLALTAGAAVGLSGCDAVRSAWAAVGGGSDSAPAEDQAQAAPSDASAAPGEDRSAMVASFDEGSRPVAAAANDGDGGGSPAKGGEDPTPERGEREVQFPATAQSAGQDMFGLDAEKLADANVPVLAPDDASNEQRQQFTDSFRSIPDGYFARWSGDDYDVVMNGTKMFGKAPEESKAPPARDVTEPLLSESETGLSVTFNKFGADYSLELVCRGAGDEGGTGCVTEDEARGLVDSLVPVGGGGR